jgi:superfamily II DNA helicase RecQ
LDQSAAQAAGSVKEKVDYRTVLDEATFEKFAKLREIRKRFAEAEAVPAYAVFTNEELAEIAKLPELTEQTIRTISGIGEKKVEKYGQKLIDEIRRDMPF